jgi:carboxylesterase type B
MDGSFFIYDQIGDPASPKLPTVSYVATLNSLSRNNTAVKNLALSQFNTSQYPYYEADSWLLTQQGFFCPSQKALAATVKAGTKVWAYLYSHINHCIWVGSFKNTGPTPESDLQILSVLNATHTAELPMVFNNIQGFTTSDGQPCNFTSNEANLSKYLTDAWTLMASVQNPGVAAWQGWNSKTAIAMKMNLTEKYETLDSSVCDTISELLGTGDTSAMETYD